jgi:hypothetical protein
MVNDPNTDLEKRSSPYVDTADPEPTEGIVLEKHIGRRHGVSYVDDLSEVEASRGWFGSLVRRLRFLRVEERGIERVREEDRVKQSPVDGFTMWASANFT